LFSWAIGGRLDFRTRLGKEPRAIVGAVKNVVLITAVLCLGSSPALSQAIDKSKPSGQACLAIVNVANGDEEMLRSASTVGPNQKIVAHLDATAEGEALVAPFLKSGDAVPGWLPQYIDLSREKEVLLPKTPVSWNWANNAGPLEIFVLFFAPGSKDGREIRELVNSMQKARGARILKFQASKLRELIGKANFDKEAARNAPKASTEVAGVMRMVVGFEWRDSARAVNFSPEKPGALIFPFADAR
jgi:hypothetical protein